MKTSMTCKVVLTLLAAALFHTLVLAGSPGKNDPAAIARGAKAWGDNCGRCHNVRSPQELRDDQWRAAMTHMRIRAGLTGEDARDILAFLQSSN